MQQVQCSVAAVAGAMDLLASCDPAELMLSTATAVRRAIRTAVLASLQWSVAAAAVLTVSLRRHVASRRRQSDQVR